MKKRTVTIFSRYDASEKTLCALYFAEQVLRRYRYVVWVVPEAVTPFNRYRGFSYKWDSAVLSLQSDVEKIKSNVNDCEICFFFDENEELRSYLSKNTKTAVFLDHHTWSNPQSKKFAEKCDYSISVSPFITKKIVKRALLANDIMCPFDPSVQTMPRVWLTSGETATLFYPAYGMSFIERQCIKQVSDIVKECCPQSKSVVGYFDNRDKSYPGVDAQAYDWRLLDYIKQTDWIIDLNPRPLMGLFACFAGSLNVQWSCFNLPPHNDDYCAARRRLIPYPAGGLTVANAPKIAEHIVRQLLTKFNDAADRNVCAGAYEKRILDYIKSLNKLLGYKSR